jgi:hypothetical protein
MFIKDREVMAKVESYAWCLVITSVMIGGSGSQMEEMAGCTHDDRRTQTRGKS